MRYDIKKKLKNVAKRTINHTQENIKEKTGRIISELSDECQWD